MSPQQQHDPRQHAGIAQPEIEREQHRLQHEACRQGNEAEHPSIYGEASPDQAKELHEEGIEFRPLPVLPDERN